jgi:hypothetical protein
MAGGAAAAVAQRRGPLLVRLSEDDEAGGEAWCSGEVTLTDSELVMERGSERRALLLTVDHYCGDCSQRANAFLLSDLVDTVYLCAETAEGKRIWMVALAGALRRLGTRKALLAAEEREHGPVQGSPHEDEPPGSGAAPARVAEPPSEAALRLERASAQLAAAERLLALCAAMREESVGRAGRAAAAAARHSASAERERAERARAEREAEQARRRAEEAERARERGARLEEERRRDAEQQAAMRAVREERARAEARAAEELIAQKNAQEAKRRSLEQVAKPPLKRLPSKLPVEVEESAQGLPPPLSPQPASPRAGTRAAAPAASKPAELPKAASASPSKPPPQAPLSPQPQQPQQAQPASGISSKVKLWSDKTKEFQNTQAENPFSGKAGATSPNNRPSQRDEDYGKAKPGSKTEERAIAAQKWVEIEVDKICAEIRKIGRPDASGRVLVEFKKLFLHYENISDTLVGILLRARKRGRIEYVGDMLFQGKDDAVIITLLPG